MKQEELEYLEGLIVKAVQSGKQETSGLVAMIMHKIENELDPAIKKHVNGQFNDFKHEFRDYVESDIKWKDDARPVIEMGKNLQGASKVMLYLTGFVITIGGAFKIITSFFDKNV